MNAQPPYLQIRIHGTDGAIRVFTHDDPDMADRILTEFDPLNLFAGNNVKIPAADAEGAFPARALTRIDLVTDRLSVWDFPFVLGAHVELMEAEYRGFLENPQQWGSPAWESDMPVLLSITMVNGKSYFFWMEVAGGLSVVRMRRLYSMLQEGRFIFGLREGGIGILNLANMAQFSVFPKPPDAGDEAQSALYEVRGNQSESRKFRMLQQMEEGRAHLMGVAEDADD